MERVHYINAGAGAGKTTTLVNILRDILTDKNNPCAPSEIILTTYTKAAAKEFREKTFKRLLEASDGLDVAKILDTATFGTVHSVAQQYLQRYWSLLGYSGQFNVMSNEDKKNYINKSLINAVSPGDLSFFHEYTKEFDVEYYDTKKELSLPDNDFWKKYVLEIVSKMRAYNIDLNKRKKILNQFAKQSCDVVDRLFASTFNQTRFDDILRPYISFLKGKSVETKKDGSLTANALKAQDKINTYNIFHTIVSPSPNDITLFLEDDCLKSSEKTVKHSLNKAKDYLKTFLFLAEADKNKVNDCIERIFRIAGDWAKQFEKYKRTNNLLDFDDLEVKFLELLEKHPAVEEDIRSSVKYLFVDEFQDSNPIQLEIFKKLSDFVQVKSFWVGDRKQAIYGFRGSDSSLTTNLLRSFPDPKTGIVPGTPAVGCTSQLIDTSYRSVRSLVKLADEVFEKSFAAGVPSEIIDNVSLCVNRENGKVTHPIQHWHCDSEDALVDRVAEILNGDVPTIPGVYDEDGTWRTQIVPADIAVLSRTKSECGKIENALRKKGIPVSSPETSIMDKAEVKLVMALLKYVAGVNRRYAKAELTKLLENKEIGDVLQDIADKRYDYNPFFDEENKEDPKDPDAFFAELNDKLQGLRGLSICAMVKGVIAAMDVRNIVVKWGNAVIRQTNLDTLIEQAAEYEKLTLHSSNCATVAGFIQYMEEAEIPSELDQSAEGVKVATYHKAKGLQWKIVILNSLDRDELDLTKFVKDNWFGLNLKGDYGNAELQLIPNCGDVSDAMAEIVEDLSKRPSGMDDNGYFNMLYGKVEGEIKRLLYVGVTRARDYLVTVSMPSGQDKTTKPLAWMANVIGTSAPAELDSPDNQENKTDVDLWGASAPPAYYEQLKEGSHTYSSGAATAVKLPAATIDGTTEHKNISPSSSKENYEAEAKLADGFSSTEIEHKTIKDYAAFGTCIHNYMAAHRWDGMDKMKDNEPANIALARRTVENHNMQNILDKPELLTQAADTLFTYLERRFGPAKELLRECPFTYCRDNGQLVQGEIDLVWKTDKDCILVDHKNFPAGQDYGKNIVLQDKPDNKFYVGKYFPQLGDYRAALNATGMNVTHVFVFYAVLGCLVEVKF